MPKLKSDSVRAPLCGADLELWRIENGLTKSEAADAFGLQKAKWEQLVNTSRAQDQLADPTIAMLLHLYRQHPEAAPLTAPPNVGEFYEFLGLSDSRHDREDFAILIGRSPPSVHRLLFDNGTPGRPVVRWIEAIKRLRMSSMQSRLLMADVAANVGEQQGLGAVMTVGWRRPSTLGQETE
jgi:hypothetical protein